MDGFIKHERENGRSVEVARKIGLPTKLALAPKTNYEIILSELERLLGKGFVTSNSWLRQSLDQIEASNQKGEKLQSDYQMSIMLMLVKHLQEIEDYDLSMLKEFRNRLYDVTNIDDYFGVRSEINAAASLIRKGIKFSKTESPDFTVQMGPTSVYIECGSSHLAKPKSGDLKYKIASLIRKKSKKVYCNFDTALFIDATNVFHNTPQEVLLTAAQFKIRTFIKVTVDSTSIGNVTVFSYVWNKDLNEFQSNYHRIDNKNISKPLTEFLDQFYSIRKFTVLNFGVPSHG